MFLPTLSACRLVVVMVGFTGALMTLAACSGRPVVVGRATSADPPPQSADVVARNVACEGCHLEIAEEWRASLHHQAHADPVYQRAFALEPMAFCTACHAPEANAEDPGPSPRHALGVACVTCHTMASSHGAVGDAHAGKAAETTRTAECASCHEFTFPQSSEKLQLTATEHRASRAADVTCSACHMPRVSKSGRAHASHRFDASRDATFVRSAARVTATHIERRVTFTFTPERVGHAFPTGDLFRRLRLVVELEGRTVEAFLGRKTKRAESPASVNASDDRPFARGEPAIVDVDIGEDSRPRAWRVLYERVEHPTTLDEREAQIEGVIEVASGHF
ncbi:multiheme c-type cytochrome [Labilithrix luteola]|uniref:multiheme c-type cytochrome n=1 Tax=Labilithrix luteola TaxID=1391654 RepID=UPI001969D861|nr:multiheme c-type cytochrome [Labilithrix luteola]